MAVQARRDINNISFILSGNPQMREAATILQDVGRTAALAPKTVMGRIATSRKYVPLTDVDPVATPGSMKCGAFGSTAAAMSAITDGSFKVQIDGEAAVHVTGLDFSEIVGLGDTKASATCGTNGGNLAAWEAVVNGGFAITVAGTLVTVADVSFDGITSLDEIAPHINGHLAGTGVECRYNSTTNVFSFWSKEAGAKQTITALAAGGTTDISGAGFLNGLTGVATLVQGTGSDDTGLTIADVINANAVFAATGARIEWDGVAFTIISPTLGVDSAVSVLTAGTAGTNIAGAGYLNGLTGTGVATAGTGLDGSEIPAAIYIGDEITAAALAAGDVTNCPMLVGGPCNLDSSQIVFENSLTLNTVVTSLHMTIEDALLARGLVPETCVNVAEYENT